MLGGRSRVRDRGNLSFGLFVCVVSSGGPRRRLVTDLLNNKAVNVYAPAADRPIPLGRATGHESPGRG